MRFYTILLLFVSSTVFAQLKPKLDTNTPVVDPSTLNIQGIAPSTPLNLEEYDFEMARSFDLKSINQEHFNVKSWADGRPVFIKGKLKSSSLKSNLEAQGRDYLSAISDVLRIENADQEFLLKEHKTDEIGMTHLRYTQMYQGFPVLGGELLLHAKNGQIQLANGFTYPTPAIDQLELIIKEDQLKQIIRADQPEKALTPRQERFIPKRWSIEPIIYHKSRKENTAQLAYHVEYFSSMIDRWIYIVDAVDGTILDKHSGVCKLHNHFGAETEDADAALLPPDGPSSSTDSDLLGINRSINTYKLQGQYYMIDASRPMFAPSSQGLFESEGMIVTLDAQNTSPSGNFNYTDVTSSNNNWSDATSVSAHYNAGEAYEYFKDVHNRNSINGQGGNVISLIHVTDESNNAMDNAFWNGAAMFYGDGAQAFFPLARGLDVAGHEISHGVVQSTANLAYQGESGAMNESFADVFGAMIDRDDWQMGEDVVKTQFFPSGALRDLRDPHNGAAQGDFNGGFQPKHVNEMFTGSADNGGVHINSGIPNHAFYLFATAVGKDKAEKVWYRALTNYLTASSMFIDLRIATIQAAGDLYGTAEIQALESAMDQVGILDGEGGDYQEDIDINGGADFLVMTDINQQDIYIANLTTSEVQKISDKDPISKPSISDDGTEIVFVATDKQMHFIRLEWDGDQLIDISESVLEDTPVWRNIVISRDGNRLAGLFDDLEPKIWVYDFTVGGSSEFTLYNPTTSSDGSTTDDVQYADALEFDFSGNWVMYDAFNATNGSGNSSIEYWDIGFLKIWNPDFGSWSLGEISKLFSSLPSDVSIGNPTFSKNSPYIIAFDYVQNGDFAVLGYNLETNDDALMRNHNGPGYPSYSRLDDAIVYEDYSNATLGGVGLSNVDATKIAASGHQNITSDFRWARWFSNGDRSTSTAELETVLNHLTVYPNPTSGVVTIDFESAQRDQMIMEVFNLLGKKVYGSTESINSGANVIKLNLDFPSGQYLLKMKTQEKEGTAAISIVR